MVSDVRNVCCFRINDFVLSLAPGGSIVSDGDPEKPVKANLCVFRTDADNGKIREFAQVRNLDFPFV